MDVVEGAIALCKTDERCVFNGWVAGYSDGGRHGGDELKRVARLKYSLNIRTSFGTVCPQPCHSALVPVFGPGDHAKYHVPSSH